MIKDIDRYHGVALRTIVVQSTMPVTFERYAFQGRLSSYIVNKRTGIHVKYSTKRLPPWTFSFTVDQLQELLGLKQVADGVWLILVCGVDGILALSLVEFLSITEARPGGVASLRVSRDRKKMYRVYGNSEQLNRCKPRGVVELLQDIFSK